MKNFLFVICFIVLYVIANDVALFKEVYNKDIEPKIVQFMDKQAENFVNYVNSH